MASYVVNPPLGDVDLAAEVYSAATGAVPKFALGTKVETQDGKIFRYCKSQAAKTVGLVYEISYAWEVMDALTTDIDNDAPIMLCVPAETKTAPSGQTYAYAWYQTGGNFAAIELLQSCEPNVELKSTATAGKLFDSTGETIYALKGVFTDGDIDAAATSAACFSHCEIHIPTAS